MPRASAGRRGLARPATPSRSAAIDFLVAIAAVLASAVLLHLAAVCLRDAERTPRPLAGSLHAATVVLCALALWWPLQLSLGDSILARAGVLPHTVAHAMPAALAALVWLAVKAWHGAQRGLAGAVALVALAAAWSLLEADPPGTPAVPAVLPALLSLPLVGLLLLALGVRERGRLGITLRAVSGVGAATVIGFAAWRSGARALGQQSTAEDWVMLGIAIGLATLLARARRAAGTDAAMLPDPPRLSAVDGITGLPLRVQFEARLNKALRDSQAAGSTLAVLQINLDGFRAINEAHGTQVGDMVLRAVGDRLRRVARSDDAVARLSGDDFLMLVTGVADPLDVQRIALRLVTAVGSPCDVDGAKVPLSCSIGVALWPGAARATRLIGCAELAMREARRLGGSRHCIYTDRLDATASPDTELLHELRNAIATHALELHFQPKVEAQSGQITAVEALLRWRHPARGMVGPDEFVPLAERGGLIGPLGDWVIEEACRQGRIWRDAGLRMRVAINLSAIQMQQEDIVQRIGLALERHGIHPSLLTCEITETVAMKDTHTTQETFRQLHAMGVHVSIDDFGTGQSSLAYLLSLQVHELKIDRAFIKNLEHDPKAQVVVDAIVKMAHALGLKVVAEGVETMGQRLALVTMGCDELQGFLLSRPMPARLLQMSALKDGPNTAEFRGSLFANTREAHSLIAPGTRTNTASAAEAMPAQSFKISA